jgi:malonate-semialdehyde dehydrogenase (acetylating)/methylmalonate-semialdehyde dehydrogenase
MADKLPLFIGGKFVQSESNEVLPVTDPATQEVLIDVPYATPDEVDAAVENAKSAHLSWRETPLPERGRLMLRYQDLLKARQEDLARILSRETGKTFADAKGDVWRGIEVVEQASQITSLMMGETAENVAGGIDTYSYLQPLGVCAGITPFNFPAMIPLWMFPMAIACGNSFVLKPSEQDPMTPNKLAELFSEAGAPDGLLQVIHGGKDQVEAVITHPDVKAVSFVGSVPVARHVYRTATSHLKRVQAMAGAKNHMVVLPDANKDQMISSLVGASCGAAGQRCMAISVSLFVGEAASRCARCIGGGQAGGVGRRRCRLRPSDQSRRQGPRALVHSERKRRGCELRARRFRLHGRGLSEWQLGGPDAFHEGHARDVDLHRGDLWTGSACRGGCIPRGCHRNDQRQSLRKRHLHLHVQWRGRP